MYIVFVCARARARKLYFNMIRRIILSVRIATLKLDTMIRVTGTMENLRRMKNFNGEEMAGKLRSSFISIHDLHLGGASSLSNLP